MMTIDSLLRGQAYHFTFTDRELDAILIDVDYALTNADKLRLFSLDENQNISAESIAVPAADYIDAAPITGTIPPPFSRKLTGLWRR